MITNSLTFRFVIILSILTILNMMFIGVSWNKKEYACSVDSVLQGVAKFVRNNGRENLNSELSEPCRKSLVSAKSEEALVSAVKNILEICEIKKSTKNSRKNFSTPIITLFTTWPNSSNPIKDNIHNWTIRNWLSFKPKVNVVVFTNDTRVAISAKSSGFHTFPILKHAGGGAPVLKTMFETVQAQFPTCHLFGYSNSDILFTTNLIETLEIVLTARSSMVDRPLMVIGRRINVMNMSSTEVKSYESIENTAKSRGALFSTNAEDFFITNKAFPWSDIAEVIVGRVAYDNWLVGHAICNLHTDVIDVSETVTAVHQTTSKGGNFEGSKHEHAHYNDALFVKLHIKPVYENGFTLCAQETSYRTFCGDVALSKRESFWSSCKCPRAQNKPPATSNSSRSA